MLKKFGFGREAPSGKKLPMPGADAGAARAQLLACREMLRVAVKGTLSQHGMGAAWVGCEVGFVSEPSQPDGPAGALDIRLIVQVWREDLLRYLPALQRNIMEALARAAPGMDHSRHRVSWAFAPDCGCKVHDLPPATSWTGSPGAPHKTGAPKTDNRRFDLPPSDFDQTRDPRDDIPSTFSATNTGFLNTDIAGLPKTNK